MSFENVVKTVLVLGVLSLSASLSGCGGSSGGSGGATPTPTPAPTPGPTATPTPTPTPVTGATSYLFYSGSIINSDGISAVDPAAPASPITVEAGTDVLTNLYTIVQAGTYDTATKTLSNIHDHAIVYAKTDGKLYKASTLKSGGTPTPTQLSSEAAADTICTIDSSSDFANLENTQIYYSTPGSNATCFDSDDVYKMVRLGMSATDAPVIIKEPVTSLGDMTTGAPSGWLVNDAGALKRCDVNFANCSMSLKSITSYVNEESSRGTDPQRLLNIDDVLYVYDGGTNTLSTAIYTLSGIHPYFNQVVSDAGKFYFLPSDAPKSIYAAPVDGSAAATLLVTDADDINGLELSANKLLYATATAFKAVARAGGAATTLLVTGGSQLNIPFVSGNHVYYATRSISGAPIAGVIDDDGSNKSETANATWAGFSRRTSWSFDGNLSYGSFIQTIFRAEGYETQGAGKGFAGGTLRSFTAASKAEVAALGTVPTDITSIWCSGLGANMLCEGYNATQRDIFFLNAETAGSLVRVTNTPTKSESILSN